ncbi:MAG: hypothetical protein JXR13_15055 [Thalassovita sp.]
MVVDTSQVKQGSTDLNMLTASGRKAEAQVKKIGTSANEVNRVLPKTGGNLRGISQQLSQVAQQGAVTGNYMQALTVQAADIGLYFGILGTAIGAAIPVLYGFAAGALEGKKSAADLEDQIEALNKSLSNLDATATSLGSPTDILEEYGRFAEAAEGVLKVQREIAQIDALRALSDAAGASAEAFGKLSGSYSYVGFAVENFHDTVRTLSKEFEISIFQATSLAEALRSVSEAEGPEAQTAALQNAREQIELAAGGLTEMSAETREVYDAMLDAQLAAAKLAAIDIASGIGEGADEGERLKNSLREALAFQLSLTNAAFRADASTYSGRGAGIEWTGPRDYQNDLNYTTVTDQIKELSRGGGRSKAANEAERQAKATQKVVDQLKAEIKMVGMAAQEREKFDAVRRAGVELSSQEGMEIAKLVEELTGLEEAKENADTLKSSLLDLAVDGASAFDDLGASIKRAAYEFLLFGDGPFSKLMGGGGGLLSGAFASADPITNFLGSLLSFDGGGRTPSGSRTGGIDGKGGFLSIMHTDETVIDHRSGQQASSANSKIELIVRSNDKVDVEALRGELVTHVDARIEHYDQGMPDRMAEIDADRRLR